MEGFVRGCLGIFFCDLDGTILPHGQKTVDRAFFDLVHRARDTGYCFCISSGRYHQSLLSFFKDVEDDLIFSTSNGCRILYKGTDLIAPHRLEYSMVQAVLADFARWDVIPLLSTLDGFYVHADHHDHPRVAALLEQDYTRLYEDPSEIPDTTLQMTALCRGNRDELLVEAKERYAPDHHVFASGVQLFDICSTSKGESLRKIRSLLNVREKDSWAFGDDENDLSMLRSAGRGYLMKNAAPHLHNQGFEIVDDLIQVIEIIITTHRFQL